MNDTVAVLGPGAVGGSLAVRLANAGVPVVCIARPDSVGLIALMLFFAAAGLFALKRSA